MANKNATIGAGMLGGAAQGASIGAATGNPLGVAIGAGVGALAGGALAYMAAADQAKTDEERQELLAKAAEEFRNIPDPETQKVVYEQLKSQGKLTPEMERDFIAPDSRMAQVSTDPRLKEAQFAALAQLAQLGEGGMDVKDLADIEAAKQRYLGQQAAQQQAVQESMARRGIASGGQEFSLRQQAAQNAANQMNQYEQQIQGEARRRALEAIMQQGQMAGNVRTQEFSEEAQKAQAADAIAKFNAQMRSATEARNIAARNQAQLGNLTEAQRIADYNSKVAAQNAAAENALRQQAFENQYRRTAGATGTPLQGQVDLAKEAGIRSANMYSGLAQGIGQAGSSYASAQAQRDAAQEQRNWQTEQNALDREAWQDEKETRRRTNPNYYSR